MKDARPQQTGEDSAVSTSPEPLAGADPGGAQALLLEAQARAGQGALDDAIALLRQALSISPEFAVPFSALRKWNGFGAISPKPKNAI